MASEKERAHQNFFRPTTHSNLTIRRDTSIGVRLRECSSAWSGLPTHARVARRLFYYFEVLLSLTSINRSTKKKDHCHKIM